MVMFMRAGKWEGVMTLPSNFFSVGTNDLKFMSFKFGNDIFITFEMPRVSYIRSKPRKSNSFYSVHL